MEPEQDRKAAAGNGAQGVAGGQGNQAGQAREDGQYQACESVGHGWARVALGAGKGPGMAWAPLYPSRYSLALAAAKRLP